MKMTIKLIFGGAMLITTALSIPQYAAGLDGVCVDAPGIPCSGGSPGGGYNIDPEYRRWIREQRRLEEEERARKREARRLYRKPYRGIEKLQKKYEKDIEKTLHRLSEEQAVVKEVTREILPGDMASVFVPDIGLGDLLLARPVNPTVSETQVATEQLQKVAATLFFMKHHVSSAEDRHFMAAQAAAIMNGLRSYIHVSVNPASPAGGLSPEQVTANIRKIDEGRQAIVKSEARRGRLLEKAKDEIKEYAALQEKLNKTGSQRKKEKLRRKMNDRAAKLDGYEKEYFILVAKEKETGEEIGRAARELQPD